MRDLPILFCAAFMEVGGDALMRLGVHGGKTVGLVLGAAVLALYGVTVNLPKWDFGQLLGVYIAIFFVTSQVVAIAAFHEKLKLPTFVGGGLIVAGGLVLTLWRVK